jgi:hypothetical protein
MTEEISEDFTLDETSEEILLWDVVSEEENALLSSDAALEVSDPLEPSEAFDNCEEKVSADDTELT